MTAELQQLQIIGYKSQLQLTRLILESELRKHFTTFTFWCLREAEQVYLLGGP